MEGDAKDLRDNEFDVISELRSFRQSISSTRDSNESSNTGVGNDGLDIVFENGMNDLLINSRSYANALVEHQQRPVITTSPKVDGGNDHRSPTALVAERRTGAVTKKKQINKRPQTSRLAASERRKVNENPENKGTNTEESDGEGWAQVDHKKRNQRKKSTGNFGVMGSRKGDNCSLKAAVRRADAYVGRVDKDVTVEDIKSFIEQTFDIEVFSVSKLDIFSDVHNVFIVCVKANVRDRLFDSDKWPEDIVVDKLYNKRSKNSDRDNASSKQSQVLYISFFICSFLYFSLYYYGIETMHFQLLLLVEKY